MFDSYPFDRLKGKMGLLVIHGDQDTTNPIDASKRMADAAKAAGVNASFATVPGGTHLAAYLTYASEIFDFLDTQRRSRRCLTMSGAAPQSHPQYGVTQIIYVLHAVSLVVGIVGTATVIGAFLLGWPSIIAVIINYVKRGDVQGTWLESHFRWQIRTFWFGRAVGRAVRAVRLPHARPRRVRGRGFRPASWRSGSSIASPAAGWR